MNSAIALMHVSKRYGKQILLDDVTVLFPKRGLIGIEGPSGSGKSTLLSLLSLQAEPDEGSIFYGEEEASAWEEGKKRDFRLRHLGFVCQKEALVQAESARWNVALPSLCFEEKGKSLRKAEHLLHRLGLSEAKDRDADSLSGGEKQRVHLARALALAPDILFADEPTSALDPERAEEAMALLKRLSKTRLVVVVSHDGKRLRRYADALFSLDGGKLKEEPRGEDAEEADPLSLSPVESIRGIPSLPLSEHFAHAKRKKKTRRARSALTESSLALGLFGAGMALYLSSSIQGQIADSFAKIVPPNTIAMERASGPETVSMRPAGKGEVSVLRDEFPDDVVSVGKVYLYDFETAFPDDRFFYYRAGVSERMLPAFSARSINDFLLLSGETRTYPSALGDLSSSEVVLGLPYETMAGLCRDFGLARGYEALGRKLQQDPLPLDFRLSSLRWGLEERLPLEAIAVVESDFPLLYHADPLWNAAVFEGAFRFRDVENEAPANPQESQSIPFVKLDGSASGFLKKARANDKTEQFLFDYPSPAINPSFCDGNGRTDEDRLYVYVASSRGISPSTFGQVMASSSRISGRLPCCAGGYFASVESALSGFSGRFFLTLEEKDADDLEKAYGDLPLEQAGLLGELPPRCVEGSVLSSGAGGLALSADLSWMDRPLEGVEEVAMSSGLFEALGRPLEIFALGETSAEPVGPTLSRTFGKAKLRVKATRKEERWTLYVPSDWTVDFFVDALRCSPLLFEPTGAMFFLTGDGGEEEEARRLESLFPGYRFASPNALVASSLSETTSYLSAVLAIFSSFALLSSILLFAFVLGLGLLEGKKETHALETLGMPRREIARFHESTVYLYIGEALLGALLAGVVSQAAVALFLSRAFSSGVSFRLSAPPFWLMLALASFFALMMKAVAFFSFRERRFARKTRE